MKKEHLNSMKFRIFLLIVVTLVATQGFSQGLVDKSADTGLMVRQIPNSEYDAVSFFSQLPVESDTIYATIFRPANCPRCDAFLNKINQLVKTETSKPTVLIAVYPDSIAAQRYIDKYKLESDYYIFDVNEDFSKFLSFSPGYLHVGYILKFNKTTGELIVGSNADNVTAAFFKELNIYNKRKEPLEYPSGGGLYHDWNEKGEKTLDVITSIPIDVPEKHEISEILYQPVYYENKLLFNDKLALAVYQFELEDSIMAFKRLVEPDSIEYSKFVNLPISYYQKLLKSNQLKNIPLQPFIINNDKFGIAYSLPELWLDEEKTLNYRNKPCYLERSFTDDDYSALIPLEYDFEDIYFYPHFDMKWAGNDEVVVGVQRITWPLMSDRNEYMNTPENNPFCDQFYSSEQPTLATYSINDGKLTYRFGTLPTFAQKTKTGYCFSHMVFDYYDEEAVYGSAYDGNIIISPKESLDCKDCRKIYKAFELDEKIFQIPDTSDYYSYNCNALSEPYLNRKIFDLKIDEKNIHCLLRHCTDAFERPEIEDYNYIIINRDSGERKTYNFPKRENGERRITYGLKRNNDGSVTPFYISFLDGIWRIYELADQASRR